LLRVAVHDESAAGLTRHAAHAEGNAAMMLSSTTQSSGLRRVFSTAVAALLVSGAAGIGCDANVNEPICPRQTTTVLERLGSLSDNKAPRIDLLLAIDNSRSMVDKQEILALSVPDLVKELVNPPCVDLDGAPAATQPAGPQEACPVAGTFRAFSPIVDMHIGVISSSLGGHGADSCPDIEQSTCAPGVNLTNNDKGRLLSRKDACDGGDVATYESKGFLAWDPAQSLEPPGEKDVASLANALRDMVLGAGQIGCGYESQLESWYRFLVDPEPYDTISVIDGKATPQGIDKVLLAQREEFLRPDSLLGIIMLSDENDCSIKEFGQFYFAGQLKNANSTPYHLPRARSECATNPNDPCCLSCGQNPGTCPSDPSCFDANNNILALSDSEDQTNLRCFDQKRRFGIDFLYPVDRYTQALTSNTVPNRSGELVPNPIFTDLNPFDSNSSERFSGQVFLLGIVGVPWQDIARDPKNLAKGFKLPQELYAEDASGQSAWDHILGDPSKYVPPNDPHMIESIAPRTGTNPITGDAIVPAGQPPSNPINGSERSIPANDDLQYACVFPLQAPRDCADSTILSCECNKPANDNPLCEEDPAKPGSRTIQTKAKAYPSLRQLAVLRSLDTQGLTASICPSQVNAPGALDFGYLPAVKLFLERIKSSIDAQCLPRTLSVDDEGRVTCRVIEARAVSEGPCTCDQKGRLSLGPEDEALAKVIKADQVVTEAGLTCLCEIEQLSNTDENGKATGNLDACQDNTAEVPLNSAGDPVHGWCYIDATTTPATGNPELVKACPETEKRNLRLVGNGDSAPGAAVFVTCGDASTCN
jgi:hypothetical protein